MTVTVKSKSKSKALSSDSRVDRLAELEKLLQPTVVLEKEYLSLVKALREEAMLVNPELEVRFVGTKADVIFGEAAEVRQIADMPGVKKALGVSVFMDIAKVNLGDVDKYLSPADLEPLITRVPGARRFKLEPK